MTALVRNRRLLSAWLLTLFFWLTPQAVQAAACCGGHAAIPSLITGFETARISTSYAQTTLIGAAPADGPAVFRQESNRPTRTTATMAGSWAFAPRWQTGASAPLGIGTDIGDAQAIVAWEAMPKPDLLSSQPKVLLFTQFVAPTGRSPYDRSLKDESEVTGQGFYRLGLGALALSTYRRWDYYALPKASVGFARGFDDGTGREQTLDPGWEGDVTVGGGYALSATWRLGASLTSSFTEGIRARSADGSSQTLSSSMWWPLDVQAAWFFDMDSVLSLSYMDETIIGPARNAVLSRALSLQYSYRWGG